MKKLASKILKPVFQHSSTTKDTKDTVRYFNFHAMSDLPSWITGIVVGSHRFVDGGGSAFLWISFVVFLHVYHIGRALLTRNEKTQAAREGKGVHENLLFENSNAVDMVVHEKGSSSVGGGSSSSFNTNNQFDMMNSRANVSQFNPSSKLRQRKSLLKNTLRFARSSIVGIGAGAGDLESGSVDVESSSKYTIES